MKKILLLAIATIAITISCQKENTQLEVLNVNTFDIDIEYEKEQLQLAQSSFANALAEANTGKTTKRFPTSLVNNEDIREGRGTRWDLQVWLNSYGLHYGNNPHGVEARENFSEWSDGPAYLFYPEHNPNLTGRTVFVPNEDGLVHVITKGPSGVPPSNWIFYENYLEYEVFDTSTWADTPDEWIKIYIEDKVLALDLDRDGILNVDDEDPLQSTIINYTVNSVDGFWDIQGLAIEDVNTGMQFGSTYSTSSSDIYSIDRSYLGQLDIYIITEFFGEQGRWRTYSDGVTDPTLILEENAEYIIESNSYLTNDGNYTFSTSIYRVEGDDRVLIASYPSE